MEKGKKRYRRRPYTNTQQKDIFCVMRPFTLMELLIVIGIMAILMTMFLPALNMARSTAKRIPCIGNLKQLHLSWMNYTDDYSGFLPMLNSKYWGEETARYWPEIMKDHLKGGVKNGNYIKKSFLCCPESPRYAVAASTIYLQYGMCIYGIGGEQYVAAGQKRNYRRIFDVTETGKAVAFGDSKNDTAGKPEREGWFMYRPMYYISLRHNGSGNVNFVDGHIETKPYRWFLETGGSNYWQRAVWGVPNDGNRIY